MPTIPVTMILGIDPRNDYAFKYLFGSEQRTGLLIHLLNAVLQLPDALRRRLCN